jgi:hypothetical protein
MNREAVKELKNALLERKPEGYSDILDGLQQYT